MTTSNIIATLRQGVHVTPRLVREIITHLERLEWAERSLKAALEKYGTETVQLTRDECGYVCDALEESERLKEAVRWLFECEACGNWMDRRGWFQDEMEEIYAAARKAVEELL